jgi:hypothetical protein
MKSKSTPPHNDNERCWWHCICPCCGQREAVLFGEDNERSCKFCGAQWNEFIVLGRFIDMKSNHAIGKSQIHSVYHFATKGDMFKFIG